LPAAESPATFRLLLALAKDLDAEQTRAAREGLSEDELALFDLLKKEGLTRAERERLKQASRDLLASIKAQLAQLDRFWEKEQTKGDVEALDRIFIELPTPPFTTDEKRAAAKSVFGHIWQQAMHGGFAEAA
jgi:type I restriction enzyme R subunit